MGPRRDGNVGQEPEISPADALDVAVRLHQAGRLDEAETIYRTLLEAFPELPEALHFQGVLRHQRGHDAEATDLIERAIAIAPDYADAHNNLGNVFKKAGQSEKAAQAYRRAVELRPDNVAAHNNLGLVLKDLERFEEATQEFRRATGLMPENAELHQNLGNVYRVQGRFVDAARAYRTAIGLRPYEERDYENLCVTLYLSGSVEEAVPVVRQWLSLDPTNPLALHRWASCAGTELPERASDEYVRRTFDGFAETFDYVLKNLDYRAPFLIRDAVAKLHPTPKGALDLLDAGCGTGLCAGLLRPHARRLVGVDLSARMLDRARTRNRYDELVQEELTAYIARNERAFDLIVSVDTLVYFGDLSGVFDAASRALRAGGKLVFTLERTDRSPLPGYQLNPHGRYSHCEPYVAHALAGAGLPVQRLEREVLRYEGGVPVDGLLVVAGLA